MVSRRSMRTRFTRFAVTLCLLLLVLTNAGANTQVDKPGEDLSFRLSHAYILDMSKVNKLAEIRNSIASWLEDNEKVAKQLDEDKSLLKGSFTEQAMTLDIKYPELTANIRKGGMSTHEYVLASHVLIRAIMLVGAKKSGEIKDYSEAEKEINPANLAFVEQHWEEVRRSMRGIRFKR